MQCSPYLNASRQWTQFSVENTAGAAKKVLEDQDISQAAVASETAGRIYGLQVLKRAINHDKDNPPGLSSCPGIPCTGKAPVR